MSRNLDPTLAAGLSAGVIQPVLLVQATFKSGVEYVWSGIGDLVFNGDTFKGVGDLGSIGPIAEGSAVKADGTSIKLSGIGLSTVDIPDSGITPPAPPVAPPFGQSVAWSYARGVKFGPSSTFPGATNGSAIANRHSATLTFNKGLLLGNACWFAAWSDFALPPEIPENAEITAVYAVITCEANGGEPGSLFQGLFLLNDATMGDLTFTGASYIQNRTLAGIHTNTLFYTTAAVPNATYYSNRLADDGTPQTLPSVILASLDLGVSGAPNEVMTVSFVGLAVYYIGTPKTKTSLIYEALNDIRMGAPATIWYGLMSNGALLGTPYRVFSGTVDKPSVQVDEKSASITLALENRLVNLQRANQRRYTAADQNLSFPTDTAFNWVETLNDIALRWGS